MDPLASRHAGPTQAQTDLSRKGSRRRALATRIFVSFCADATFFPGGGNVWDGDALSRRVQHRGMKEMSEQPLANGFRKDAAELAGKATAAASQFSDKAASAASAFSDRAGKTVDDAREQVGRYAAGAASSVSENASTAKAGAADAVANLARGAREVADGIEDQSPQVAGVVRTAADGVERLSGQIRDRDIGDLINAVTDFTRRRPAVALGCGVLAGIVLTRLLRGSAEA